MKGLATDVLHVEQDPPIFVKAVEKNSVFRKHRLRSIPGLW